MSNITISDLKPVQSQNEAMSDAELNMITGGGDIGISPYVKPYYDFSGKFGVGNRREIYNQILTTLYI